MDNLPEVLTRINNRLDALESRVAHLEHPAAASDALPAPAPRLLEFPRTHPTASSFTQSGATFAVVGKAMLGIAGAYLLRAVAESGSFPKYSVAALAILYACTWLVSAMRVPPGHWFAATTYAGASALIFTPMLWELTLRFRVFSPFASAALLAGFVCTAFALSWKRRLTPIVWVATLATTIAAIALLIATHDLEPFLAALLFTALLSEASGCRNRWLSVRPIVALAADLAAWILLYIYANPDRNLADYPALGLRALIAPPILLFLVYGSSIAMRTIRLRQAITLFETGQAMVAFVLAAYAVLHFAPALGSFGFGVFCLALCVTLYAIVFAVRAIDCSRNLRVYCTWSLALFLLGIFLCLPAPWLSTVLGIAAIVATYTGASQSRIPLAFHGLVYLCAAAATSGLSSYTAHAVAGAFPRPPEPATWIIAAVIILCYAIGGQLHDRDFKSQLFHTLSAALAIGAAAAALVSALVWIATSVITPGAPHVAVIRTLTACALALTLAWLGPRWHRVQLVWLGYATLAAVAAKLLLEDLRHGHPEFIAASIFLYAVSLMLVPRIVRKTYAKWRPTQAHSS